MYPELSCPSVGKSGCGRRALLSMEKFLNQTSAGNPWFTILRANFNMSNSRGILDVISQPYRKPFASTTLTCGATVGSASIPEGPCTLRLMQGLPWSPTGARIAISDRADDTGLSFSPSSEELAFNLSYDPGV